jgi:hypothetical protein
LLIAGKKKRRKKTFQQHILAKISITARQCLAGNLTINGQNSSTANVADVDDTAVHPLKLQSLGSSLSPKVLSQKVFLSALKSL